MPPIEDTTYQAIVSVLASKEMITVELLAGVLQTAGITPGHRNFQNIMFMLRRFLFSARIKQVYTFEDNDPCVILIVEMLTPSLEYD
jgi:hypothetical protein